MAFRINKVLISDEISEKCPAILRAKGVEVVHKTKMPKAELIAELAVRDFHVNIVDWVIVVEGLRRFVGEIGDEGRRWRACRQLVVESCWTCRHWSRQYRPDRR